MRIGFIGAGRVGTTLAMGLTEKGYTVAATASRSRASAESLALRVPGCRVYDMPQDVVNAVDLVFLTVSDDSIRAVAGEIAWRAEIGVVHCSGALDLDVLDTALRAGAQVGSFHPLQTFASIDVALRELKGATIAIQGSEGLVPHLEAMAVALGGRPLRLPAGSRALYHASAYFAGAFPIALIHEAAQIWHAFGIDHETALQALLPLARGAIESVARAGTAGGLSGAVARGDIGTIRRHIEALRSETPESLTLFCRMSLLTIPLAIARGSLTEERAREIRALLEAYQEPENQRTKILR